MFDIVMEVFWCICSLIGISVILLSFFKITRPAQRFFEFMKRHRTIGLIYALLGAVGIFKALIFR